MHYNCFHITKGLHRSVTRARERAFQSQVQLFGHFVYSTPDNICGFMSNLFPLELVK